MIYAVNKRTKEHRVIGGGERNTDDEWIVPADAEGWIKWHGGECPLPDGQRYEVKNRDGEWGEGVIGKWVHGSYQRSFDIIAYRPILGDDTKPEPPAWDGEGLPPVGCECECYIPSRDVWAKVKIVAHDGDVAIFKNGAGHLYAGALADLFRPIRSEEDRAVEEMVSLFNPERGYSFRDLCRGLYRAGYRKTGAN